LFHIESVSRFTIKHHDCTGWDILEFETHTYTQVEAYQDCWIGKQNDE